MVVKINIWGSLFFLGGKRLTFSMILSKELVPISLGITVFYQSLGVLF